MPQMVEASGALKISKQPVLSIAQNIHEYFAFNTLPVIKYAKKK